jgi:hypothetical protein
MQSPPVVKRTKGRFSGAGVAHLQRPIEIPPMHNISESGLKTCGNNERDERDHPDACQSRRRCQSIHERQREQHGRYDRHRQFEISAEQVRSCNAYKDTPGRPAQRKHQIEKRKFFTPVRLGARQLAMTKHAPDEQGDRECGDFPAQSARLRDTVTRCYPRAGQQPSKQSRAIPAVPFEAQNKAEQVQAQGQHPEKGNGRYFLAEVIRDREPQRRGARCETDPKQWPAPGA